MHRFYVIFILTLLSSPSFGFGQQAHKIIAEIAQQHLSEKANQAITDILEGESLASASVWADEMRYSNEGSKFWSYNYSSSWHFVNIGKNKSYQQSSKNPQGDAYVALMSFIAVLENKRPQSNIINQGIKQYLKETQASNKELATKKMALKFLIHIVSDLHQPLHVGYKEDRGGNTIEVRWFGRKTNLHSVWDTRLVNSQNLSVQEYQQKLQNKISRMKPAELSKIQQSNAIAWINEGLLLRDDIYDVKPYNSQFSEKYVEEFTPLMESLLIKAGLRLAATLNGVFE